MLHIGTLVQDKTRGAGIVVRIDVDREGTKYLVKYQNGTDGWVSDPKLRDISNGAIIYDARVVCANHKSGHFGSWGNVTAVGFEKCTLSFPRVGVLETVKVSEVGSLYYSLATLLPNEICPGDLVEYKGEVWLVIEYNKAGLWLLSRTGKSENGVGIDAVRKYGTVMVPSEMLTTKDVYAYYFACIGPDCGMTGKWGKISSYDAKKIRINYGHGVTGVFPINTKALVTCEAAREPNVVAKTATKLGQALAIEGNPHEARLCRILGKDGVNCIMADGACVNGSRVRRMPELGEVISGLRVECIELSGATVQVWGSVGKNEWRALNLNDWLDGKLPE